MQTLAVQTVPNLGLRTLGEGTTEKVIIMRSGYSSRILLISRVPMPEPVPPPSEWHSWKPAGRGTVERLEQGPDTCMAGNMQTCKNECLVEAAATVLPIFLPLCSAPPCRQSQPSASLRTTSSTESISSAPSV